MWTGFKRNDNKTGLLSILSVVLSSLYYSMKLKHQDTQGYYWWDVVWGGQEIKPITIAM